MKTPEEIVNWLKGQIWYRSYKKNVINNYKDNKVLINEFLNGLKGIDTL